MNYIVRKAFKYGGVILKPGEEFVPQGGKYDESIVEQGQLVVMVDGRMKQRKLKRLGLGKKTNLQAQVVEQPKAEQPKAEQPKKRRGRKPRKAVTNA